MAKRRERNVGQLSLFDAMASQIEQIRAENIQDDMREESTSEPASQPEENEGRQPEPARKANFFSFPTNDAASIKRLGVNGNGDSVYELKDGSRMYSGNPEIIQVMDGEKRTPEQLYAGCRRQLPDHTGTFPFHSYSSLGGATCSTDKPIRWK